MGLWDRLTQGLKKTQDQVTGRIEQAFQQVVGEKLDDDTEERLEEALLESDLGPAVTDRLIEALESAAASRTPRNGGGRSPRKWWPS
jgi:fused signal recognition particle receptor